MDYEAIDREMSSYVVACTHQGTRFYLTDERTASDIFSRARRHRWLDQAEAAAQQERIDPAWRNGFDWEAASVASECAQRGQQAESLAQWFDRTLRESPDETWRPTPAPGFQA